LPGRPDAHLGRNARKVIRQLRIRVTILAPGNRQEQRDEFLPGFGVLHERAIGFDLLQTVAQGQNGGGLARSTPPVAVFPLEENSPDVAAGDQLINVGCSREILALECHHEQLTDFFLGRQAVEYFLDVFRNAALIRIAEGQRRQSDHQKNCAQKNGIPLHAAKYTLEACAPKEIEPRKTCIGAACFLVNPDGICYDFSSSNANVPAMRFLQIPGASGWGSANPNHWKWNAQGGPSMICPTLFLSVGEG
jgi:hypothetical protein